jgi:hypothetical protein
MRPKNDRPAVEVPYARERLPSNTGRKPTPLFGDMIGAFLKAGIGSRVFPIHWQRHR